MNLNMISNYLKAKWSKGIDNKKVDVTTKDIRLLGCFGDGDVLSVCPALRPSEEKMGKFYCNDCNCGDKASTWLNGDEQDYTKLDHPYLSCPRKMPGFSDYESSTDEDNVQEQRKKSIEVMLGDMVLNNKQLIRPEMPEEEKAKLAKQRAEQTEKDKKCPSCELKQKLREDIIEELQKNGYTPNWENETYKEMFMTLWNVRVKSIESREPKKEGGCPSCEAKKQLRDKIIQELLDEGIEKNSLEFNKKFQSIWESRT